jgi:hypothetical protein
MSPVRILPLLLLAGCWHTVVDYGDDGAGDTDRSVGPGGACDATVNVELPSGATTSWACLGATVETQLEFDPDDAPELRMLSVRLEGSHDDAFQCSVTFRIEPVCGEGAYAIGARASLSAELFDCEGVPDAYEGRTSAVSGAVVLDTVRVPNTPGNLSGEPIQVRFDGSFDVEDADGVRLQTQFSVRREVVADDAEEQLCGATDAFSGGSWSGSRDEGGGCDFGYELEATGGSAPGGCPACDVAGKLQVGGRTGDCATNDTGTILTYGLNIATGTLYERVDDGSWVEWGDGDVSGRAWEGIRPANGGVETLDLTW